MQTLQVSLIILYLQIMYRLEKLNKMIQVGIVKRKYPVSSAIQKDKRSEILQGKSLVSIEPELVINVFA